MTASIIRGVSAYRVREAALDDLDVLVHHRVAMFTDMGVVFDAPALADVTRVWLGSMIPAGEYHAWVCETATGDIVAGGGASILKWPPGPLSVRGDRLAFVYNVYTEPGHRKRGLARRVMEAIHGWCDQQGIGALALNAAPDARHLYDSLGYVEAPSPMLFKVTPPGLAKPGGFR
jgi:GNAT superfamily N-acetyltransferase